jgi:hypothetical protein
MEVTLYDSDEEPTVMYALPIDTIEVPATKPHPKYTSCPPAARNVIVGDDSPYMPFIPYEDDMTFDHEAQMEHYDHFRWQNMADPDGITSQFISVPTQSLLSSRSHSCTSRQDTNQHISAYAIRDYCHQHHTSKLNHPSHLTFGRPKKV